MSPAQAVKSSIHTHIQVTAGLHDSSKALIAVCRINKTGNVVEVSVAEGVGKVLETKHHCLVAVADVLHISLALINDKLVSAFIIHNRLYHAKHIVKAVCNLSRQIGTAIVVIFKNIQLDSRFYNILLTQLITVKLNSKGRRNSDFKIAVKSGEIKTLISYHPGQHAILHLICVALIFYNGNSTKLLTITKESIGSAIVSLFGSGSTICNLTGEHFLDKFNALGISLHFMRHCLNNVSHTVRPVVLIKLCYIGINYFFRSGKFIFLGIIPYNAHAKQRCSYQGNNINNETDKIYLSS